MDSFLFFLPQEQLPPLLLPKPGQAPWVARVRAGVCTGCCPHPKPVWQALSGAWLHRLRLGPEWPQKILLPLQASQIGGWRGHHGGILWGFWLGGGPREGLLQSAGPVGEKQTQQSVLVDGATLRRLFKKILYPLMAGTRLNQGLGDRIDGYSHQKGQPQAPQLWDLTLCG